MSEMDPHYQMLRVVSRTFALSIEQLPRGPRDALTLGYLLLRVSDGLEDYPALEAAHKAELLRLWERVLAGDEAPARIVDAASRLDAANPEIQVALVADELLRLTWAQPPAVRGALLHYVRRTTLGMARWQEQGPVVATEAELDDYMHQVAGLVGYLITEVFAAYSPAVARRRERLLPLAREFGLGLQTVNIVRGLRADHARGWTFVPRDYYAPLGLGPAQLFDPARRAEAMRVVDVLVAKAERHLRYGLQYVLLLPRREHRLRLMCAWPLLFAARTLALSRGNPAVLGADVKIDRAEVRAIMRRSTMFGWSNRWLRGYYDALDPAGRVPGRGPDLALPSLAGAYLPHTGGWRANDDAPVRADGGVAEPGGRAAQAAQPRQSPTTSSR